ncbi:MAG: sugar transferase [Epsilonproteobacteria bacterium]|nr:sugar transferase [Campylobacterota bacterium]
MLILGRNYKFTSLELQRLNKKFKKITTVKYTNRDTKDVLDELANAISNNGYKVLILNTKDKVDDEIIKYLTKIRFQNNKKIPRIISIEHFLEEYLHKCYIPEDNNDLHFLEDIRPYNPFEYGLKRVVDYLGVSILMLSYHLTKYVVAKKQAKESPGNLYFTQERVGKDTKTFQCYKFRTMHEDSYHDPYTKEGDSRIYPYGEFMRKTRIDEIPQVKNILKGEMHLIGPRAEWNILVENYEKEIPYYHERHIVAPGITGWAQVNYPYGANLEDTKQKLMYDLYYIKHWSIALELKVIWKTIMVVVGKKGL